MKTRMTKLISLLLCLCFCMVLFPSCRSADPLAQNGIRSVELIKKERIDLLVTLNSATLEKHKGQKRIGGDDYITHPIAVYEIVKSRGLGESYQIAALFHDLLEDTDATESEILSLSNQNVLDAVKLLTKEKGYDMKTFERVKRNQ